MIITGSDDEPKACCCINIHKCAIIIGICVAVFCGIKVGSDSYNLTIYKPSNTHGEVSKDFVATVIDLSCHSIFAIAGIMLIVGAICRNKCLHLLFIICAVIYLVICLIIVILLIVVLVQNQGTVYVQRGKTTADVVIGILLPLFVSYGLSVAIESRNNC